MHQIKMRLTCILPAAVMLACKSLWAATLAVSNVADGGPGSLRSAIANAQPGDTIVFSLPFGSSLVLTNGELPIPSSLSIVGPGAAYLTLDGNGSGRIFNIGPGAQVRISGLTLTHGSAISGGAILCAGDLTLVDCALTHNWASGYGGALASAPGGGHWSVSGCTFSQNEAGRSGGAISAGLIVPPSPVTINTLARATTYSVVSLNGTGTNVVVVPPGASMSLTAVYSSVYTPCDPTVCCPGCITQHYLGINGAQLDCRSFTQETNGVVNIAFNAPALPGVYYVTQAGSWYYYCNQYGPPTFYNDPSFAVAVVIVGDPAACETSGSFLNCTLSRNLGGQQGGALAVGALAGVSLQSSTIASNTASSGGGLLVSAQASASALTLQNTIVAANAAAQSPDIAGAVASQGHSLVGTPTGAFGFLASDLLNVDPLLGPLANNGGQTLTHAPQSGSPAIDAGQGPAEGAPNLDQRGPGYLRAVNGRMDIGAVELGCGMPVFSCPAPILAYPSPGQCTAIVNFTNAAANRCGPVNVVCTPVSGSQFNLGRTTVTCTAPGDWLPGLAHYFNADSTAVDLVTGQAAQLGAGVTFAPGVSGGAFDFAGSGDGYVTTGISALYGPWTASFWINRLDTPTVSAVLTADENYALKLEQFGTARFVGITQFGYVDWSFDPTYTAPVGLWTHLVFVADGTDTRLYVNGQFAGIVPGVSLPLPLRYLSRPGQNDWLKGLLDEVAVFDRVLTEQEISDLYTYKTVNSIGKCSFDIVVQDAVTPVFLNFPASMTAYTGPTATHCAVTVTWTPPTATASCGAVTVTSDRQPGESFTIGTNLVTYRAVEVNGKTAVQSFTVTVVDNTPPSLQVPPDVTVPADLGACSAGQGSLGVATATDNCGVVTIANDAPAVFPVGLTTVTWTATDPSGNQSTATQAVMVVDIQAPTIAVPSTIVADPPTGQCTAVVSFSVTGTDNCATSLPVQCQPASGSAFSYGTNWVLCIATDPAGNSATNSFAIVVRDPLNISWPSALRLATATTSPNTVQAIQLQLLAQLGEARWYKITVSPDSKLVVTLTGLHENFNLFLFKDIAAAYNAQLSPQDLVKLSAEFAPSAFSPSAFSSEIFSPSAFSPSAFSPSAFSPSAFSPSAFSPSAFSPSAFSPSAFSPSAFSPSAFSPSAFSPSAFSPSAFSPSAFSPSAFSPSAFSPSAFSPSAFSSAQTRTLIGISAFPGTADQGIVVDTYGDTGDYYICVRGANGAYNQPGEFYQLAVAQYLGLCGNIAPIVTQPTTVATAGGYKTLILSDLSRLTGTGAEKAALQAAISSFAARPEVAGVFVNVGQDLAVIAANLQADGNLSCTYAKNVVAGVIHQIAQRFQAQNPLEYVVLIGGDDVIPFFRYPDEAGLANEAGFDVPVNGLSASQASIKSGQVLSQDDYGSFCSISLKNSRLVLPDAAVGRLVETATEATGLINAYLATANGVVPTPASALVTGYDFLQDCATAVAGQLAGSLGSGNVTTLISPNTAAPANSWTAAQLRPLLLNSRHDITFLAGHFNSGSLLAADFATSLFSKELANSSVNLVNALVYSAGCHSGYSVVDADAIPYVTVEPDWAQMFARKQATFIAGTGYQYGDTDFIEYDERLYLNFTEILREGTGPVAIGKALVKAKQRYLANTPLLRGIHEKSLREVTLFGLPMLSMNLPNRVPAPTSTSIVSALNSYTTNPGLALGLQSADVTIPITGLALSNSTLTIYPVPTTGPATLTASYHEGPDGHVSNPAEPILPLVARNVTAPATVLRGVGFRSGVYQDTDGIRPLTGAPATENRGVHAPFLTPVFYPLKPWSANYFDALCGVGSGTTRLNLLPSQYRSASPTSDTGTRRIFSSMGFRLFYSAYTANSTSGSVTVSPAAAAPPTIVSVTDSFDPASNTVGFRVQVTGDPNAGMQAVWITYTGTNLPLAGQWQSVDLAQDSTNSTLWTGSLPLPNGVTASSLLYLVQAVNGVGLVTLDNNLGSFYSPAGSAASGTTAVQPSASTQIAFVAPPATGTFGDSAQFQVSLTTNGIPVPGAIINFALGSQFLQSPATDANGTTTASLPLLAQPGQYAVSATFLAQPGLSGATASTPFTIARLATSLALAPGAANVPLSNIVATLTDAHGNALPGKTVFFVVSGGATPAGLAATTDFGGQARLVDLGLAPGYYTLSAFFSGNVPAPISQVLSDPQYLASTASLTTETQPPTIVPPPAITVNSPADVPAPDFAGGNASDNRTGVTVQWAGDAPSAAPACGGTIVRTYVATDAAGNTASASQIITILPQLAISDEQVVVHYDSQIPGQKPSEKGAYSRTEVKGNLQFCDGGQLSDVSLSSLSASQVSARVTATLSGRVIADTYLTLKVNGSQRDVWESKPTAGGQVDSLKVNWKTSLSFDASDSNPKSPALQAKFIGLTSSDLRYTSKPGNYVTTFPNGVAIAVTNGLVSKVTGLDAAGYEVQRDKKRVDLTVPYRIVPGMTFVTAGTVSDTIIVTVGTNFTPEQAQFQLKLRSDGLTVLPLFTSAPASLQYEITLGTGAGEHPTFGRSVIGDGSKPWDKEADNHRRYRDDSKD